MTIELFLKQIKPTKQVVLVQERNNPSTDYFVLPLLKQRGFQIELVNHDVLPVDIGLVDKLLVFVRYVPHNWVRHIEKYQQQIAGLVLFFDDDLFDMKSLMGLPLKYQIKLFKLSYLRKFWLNKIGAKLWVSTPFLANKYAEWDPMLVFPSVLTSEESPSIRIFYHGSSSHSADIEWLFPVVKSVLEQQPSLSFEIIGNKKVNKLFKTLPRVTVIHPMSWTNYQSFIAQPGRHIGLAPMLDNAFNAARSYTKFFDNCRAGSVGIYANHAAFRRIVKHEVNGLLLDMSRDVWVKAILSLASDEVLRQNMLKQANETCQKISNNIIE